MPDQLEEIRSKIDILDLVSQYTQPKKAGRNYKALCPFHNEKTPSFMVSPDKQIAYCFGCHKGGDIFKFYMEVENVDFGEALRSLAKRAGVEIERVRPEAKSQRARLLELNEIALKSFEENLRGSSGKQAMDYLAKRGLSDAHIADFNLGYALDSFDNLYKKIVQKDFSVKELLQAGLVTQKDFSESSVYDRFRNRIIFPVHNLEGEAVAFAGRVMDDSLPKYLNSPETQLYHKGSVLYNLHRAKESIREKDFVLLVEGYMDAITPYCAGIKNVVAVCGTALTDEQIKKIKRYTSNIYFCFDGDAAGIEAMKRNALPALRQQMILKAIPLTKYKDPDEYIRNEPGEFTSLIELPQDFMEYLLGELSKKYDIASVAGRRSFMQELLPLLKAIPLQVEQDLYIQKVSQLLGVPPQAVRNDMLHQKDYHSSRSESPPDAPRKRAFEVDHYIVGLVALYPEFIPILNSKVRQPQFVTDFLNSIYTILVREYNSKGSVSIEDVDILAEEREKLKILTLLIEQEYGNQDLEKMRLAFEKLVEHYKKTLFQRKKKEYLAKLRQLEKENSPEYEDYYALYKDFLASGV